jgi:hypothetical protein
VRLQAGSAAVAAADVRGQLGCIELDLSGIDCA